MAPTETTTGGDAPGVTTQATHWWLYEVVVENETRSSQGRIEYRWYHQEITRFEASWVAGQPRRNGRIHVRLNGNLVGSYSDKAQAAGHVRRLIARCPAACRKEFEAHQEVFWWAIDGR
jgi:hypothetical protein